MTHQVSSPFDGASLQSIVQSATTTSTGAQEGQTAVSLGKIKLSAVHAAAKLFKDPQNANSKTPISLLQEICSKSLLAPPIYTLLSAEGGSHSPTFSYKCHLTDEFMAVGKGSSKKRAKHSAALAVLQMLRDANVGVNDTLVEALSNLMESLVVDPDATELSGVVVCVSETNASDAQQVSPKKTTTLEDGTVVAIEEGNVSSSSDLPACENPEFEHIRQACLNSINPVGELIEIAQRMSARPPDFVFGDEQGPPHNRQFTCVVRFDNIEETGYGKAKKAAKRQAAVKLLYKLKTSEAFLLKQQQQQPSNGLHKNGFDKARKENNGLSSAIRSGQTISRKGNQSQLPNLYQQMRTSTKEAVKRLLAYDVEKDEPNDLNKEFLDILAREENFDYKIYQKIVRDKLFIFFQFTTNPSIVIFGPGSNLEEALKNAAYSSLLHLKLMCSR